jgi:hypothetical protein
MRVAKRCWFSKGARGTRYRFRPTGQRVTILGDNVYSGSDAVRSVGITYDGLGRREKVTAYTWDQNENPTPTALNEVKYAYNDLGALDKEYQEHEGVVDANTLYVQYGYDTTSGAYNSLTGVYTKGVRPASLRYPNARLAYDLYTDPGDTSGVGDAISRVAAVAAASTRGQNDANVLASVMLPKNWTGG